MENIINHILKMDEEASERLAEAEKRRSDLLNEAKIKREQLHAGAQQRAKMRLDVVDMTNSQDAELHIKHLNEETERICVSMQELFDRNHLSWENEIFNNITQISAFRSDP